MSTSSIHFEICEGRFQKISTAFSAVWKQAVLLGKQDRFFLFCRLKNCWRELDELCAEKDELERAKALNEKIEAEKGVPDY